MKQSLKRGRCAFAGLPLLIAFSALAFPPFPAQLPAQLSKTTAPAATLSLAEGTVIHLATCTPAFTRARVELEVAEDVMAGGFVILPRGTPAWGKVTSIQPPPYAWGAHIGISAEGLRLATGENAALRGSRKFKWVGKEAYEVPGGSFLDATLAHTIVVDREKLQAVLPPSGVKVLSMTNEDQESALQAVMVIASPVCSEIEIDGKYVSLTPSTITLPLGEHLLRVKKAGYQSYEMRLESPAGRIKIDVDLQRTPESAPVSSGPDKPS